LTLQNGQFCKIPINPYVWTGTLVLPYNNILGLHVDPAVNSLGCVRTHLKFNNTLDKSPFLFPIFNNYIA